MISTKYQHTFDEWNNLHPALREIILWLDENWPGEFLTLTRIYDPAMPGESGVHRHIPHRAADIRVRDQSHRNTNVFGTAICCLVNLMFDHGSQGQYHVAGFHNNHIHLQVRDSTKRTRVDLPFQIPS